MGGGWELAGSMAERAEKGAPRGNGCACDGRALEGRSERGCGNIDGKPLARRQTLYAPRSGFTQNSGAEKRVHAGYGCRSKELRRAGVKSNLAARRSFGSQNRQNPSQRALRFLGLAALAAVR